MPRKGVSSTQNLQSAVLRIAMFLAHFLLFLPILEFFTPVSKAQTFVQVGSATPTTGSTVSAAYTQAQGGGDLNVVVVGWNDTTATVSSVTDTKGNVYQLAVGPTAITDNLSQSIYYAKNITGAAAGANTVTVKFSTTAQYPDIRIMEYSGLDANNPLDVVGGATGSNSTTDSGAIATTNANDLLVGANTVSTSVSAAGSGYTKRIITSPDGDLVEDRVVTAAGSYHGTATLSRAGAWVMQVVAFRAGTGVPAPSAPGSLTAIAAMSSQINLSWTASTEVGGTVASYLVERCQGAGCTNFSQIGTTTALTYSDAGLSPLTNYSYRVRAQDTAGGMGPYSSTASAQTPGTGVPTPSAPGNLTAVGGATGPVVVVVQGYINATSQTVHTTAAFNSSGGDLLVMCASSHGGVTMTPVDSFGNSWVTIAGPTSTVQGDDLRTQVWYARNPVVGAGHTVTVNLSAEQPLVISVVVVKGSNGTTPLGGVTPIGSDNGSGSLSVASANLTTTTASNLLIGFGKVSISTVWNAWSGYVLQSSGTSPYMATESGFVGTAGSYASSFGITGSATWQTALVAVNPSAGAASPTQINLSWTASTEVGGTVASYLVERCQGAGCTNFSQIGTTAGLTLTDTNVVAGGNYSYRVRAQDTANTLGPYSNAASVALH